DKTKYPLRGMHEKVECTQCHVKPVFTNAGKNCQDCHTDVQDRKSTRLNSSHVSISYAVFCLKKKKSLDTLSYGTRLTATVRTPISDCSIAVLLASDQSVADQKLMQTSHIHLDSARSSDTVYK